MGAVGVVFIMVAGIVAVVVPRRAGRAAAERLPTRALYGHVLASRSALALLGVGLFFAVPWAMWQSYVVVFFQSRFELSQGVASTLVLSGGVGMVVGSQLAGRLAVRAGYTRILGATTVALAVLLGLVTNAPLALAAAVAANLLISAVSGARVVSHQSMLSEQVPAARATLLAFGASTMAASSMLGALIGGVVLDAAGFWLMGIVAVASLVSARVLMAWVNDPAPARAPAPVAEVSARTV